MDATHQFTTAILIRKLESIFTLADDERKALEALPMQVVALKEGQDIVRMGDRPSRSCLILSGFTCMYKVTGDGKRQIHNFNIPGDIPDLQSLHLQVLDNSLGTLTPCSVGFITHEALDKLCERHYRIAKAFWRETDPPPLNWSTLKYVLRQTGGPQCPGSATSRKRSSPSCARSMSWSHKANPWPMR